MQTEFRVLANSDTAGVLQLTIQETSDPTFASTWSTNGSVISITGTNTFNPKKSGYSGFQRFIRAKLTIVAAGVYALVSATGVAREP
jgi:hypothetical protein